MPNEQAFRWFRDENNELCAEVMQIDGLYDVSIVTEPAYEDTFVDARNFDLEAIKRSLDEAKEEQERSNEEVATDFQRISILNSIDEKRKNILQYI